MDMQQRRYDQTPLGFGSADPAAGGAALEQARDQGQRLLDAADAAINRALSGNAEAFLVASRQEGGQ